MFCNVLVTPVYISANYSNWNVVATPLYISAKYFKWDVLAIPVYISPCRTDCNVLATPIFISMSWSNWNLTQDAPKNFNGTSTPYEASPWLPFGKPQWENYLACMSFLFSHRIKLRYGTSLLLTHRSADVDPQQKKTSSQMKSDICRTCYSRIYIVCPIFLPNSLLQPRPVFYA
jgi:hypothetical protein